MYGMVILLFVSQLSLCDKGGVGLNSVAAATVQQYVEKGKFAQPECCEAPWNFDSNTGECMLDMKAQGVKERDMASLCIAVGFQLKGVTCVRYVQLLHRYEKPITGPKVIVDE